MLPIKKYAGSFGTAECGPVIWITGLSGVGKTTLAREVVGLLRQRGTPVLLLDGDELRAALSSDQQELMGHGYSREARLSMAKRYSRLCQLFSLQGFTVVIATISLFREVHEWNRLNLAKYFEVYLRAPIAELRRRDPKGLYREFDRGQSVNLVGLDLALEEPEKPDWVAEVGPRVSPEQLALNLVERFDIWNLGNSLSGEGPESEHLLRRD